MAVSKKKEEHPKLKDLPSRAETKTRVKTKKHQKPKAGTVTFSMDELSGNSVHALAAIGFSQSDIARKFGVSPSNINRNYREAFDTGRATMHEQIRAAQMELAIAGKNPQMLIHLGKTELKQTDETKVIHEISPADEIPSDALLEFMIEQDDRCIDVDSFDVIEDDEEDENS
jgi:hypothetical protein